MCSLCRKLVHNYAYVLRQPLCFSRIPRLLLIAQVGFMYGIQPKSIPEHSIQAGGNHRRPVAYYDVAVPCRCVAIFVFISVGDAVRHSSCFELFNRKPERMRGSKDEPGILLGVLSDKGDCSA